MIGKQHGAAVQTARRIKQDFRNHEPVIAWEIKPLRVFLYGTGGFWSRAEGWEAPGAIQLETEEVVSKIWLPVLLPVVCLPSTIRRAISGKPIQQLVSPTPSSRQ